MASVRVESTVANGYNLYYHNQSLFAKILVSSFSKAKINSCLNLEEKKSFLELYQGNVFLYHCSTPEHPRSYRGNDHHDDQ